MTTIKQEAGRARFVNLAGTLALDLESMVADIGQGENLSGSAIVNLVHRLIDERADIIEIGEIDGIAEAYPTLTTRVQAILPAMVTARQALAAVIPKGAGDWRQVVKLDDTTGEVTWRAFTPANMASAAPSVTALIDALNTPFE